MTPKTAALLETGQEPVKIACFGDSITGVYYHTGGVRAYADMLGIALQRIYPQAKLTVLNAGVSGHTTVAGLERIERDVLAERPQLVTVMFGMNDVAGLPVETYRENLREIVRQCRGIGAEVVLCTPNSVYPEDERRPVDKLAQYAQTVHDVAGELAVPVADCWQAYEDIRAADRRAWMLLLSETIHPNMNGHRVFAEVIAQVISGRRVSLDDVGPPASGLSHTAALLAEGKPVRVLAMPPFDGLIEQALTRAYPGSQVQVTTWPVAGQTLAEIEAYARDHVGWAHLHAQPQARRPDLVIIAIPADAPAPDEEQFIRSYSWVLNWSLSFGKKEWDCIAVLPSVTTPEAARNKRARLEVVRAIVRGQDIPFVDRSEGDASPFEALFGRWLDDQLREGEGM